MADLTSPILEASHLFAACDDLFLEFLNAKVLAFLGYDCVFPGFKMAVGGRQGMAILDSTTGDADLVSKHKSAVTAVFWKRDPTAPISITTASADGAIRSFNAETGKQEWELKIGELRLYYTVGDENPQSPSMSLAVTPSRMHVLTGDTSGHLNMMLSRDQSITWSSNLGAPVRCVACHPDGKVVLAGCGDGHVRFFHVDPESGILSLRDGLELGYPVGSLSFSSDGTLLAASGGSVLRIFDTDARTVRAEVVVGCMPAFCKWIIPVCMNILVLIFVLISLSSLLALGVMVESSPDKDKQNPSAGLITAAMAGWGIPCWLVLFLFGIEQRLMAAYVPISVAWNPCNTLIATVCDHKLSVVDGEAGSTIGNAKFWVERNAVAAWSPDGRLLAVASRSIWMGRPVIRILDQGCRVIRNFQVDALSDISSLEWSP
jgi:WD40 repeat protein